MRWPVDHSAPGDWSAIPLTRGRRSTSSIGSPRDIGSTLLSHREPRHNSASAASQTCVEIKELLLRVLLTLLFWLSAILAAPCLAAGYDPLNTAAGTPRDGIRWLDPSSPISAASANCRCAFIFRPRPRRRRRSPLRSSLPRPCRPRPCRPQHSQQRRCLRQTLRRPERLRPPPPTRQLCRPRLREAPPPQMRSPDRRRQHPWCCFRMVWAAAERAARFWASIGRRAATWRCSCNTRAATKMFGKIAGAERLPALKKAVTLQTFVDRVMTSRQRSISSSAGTKSPDMICMAGSTRVALAYPGIRMVRLRRKRSAGSFFRTASVHWSRESRQRSS